MLIYEDSSGVDDTRLRTSSTATRDMSVRGTFYLPSGNLTVNGNSNTSPLCFQLWAATLRITGNTTPVHDLRVDPDQFRGLAARRRKVRRVIAARAPFPRLLNAREDGTMAIETALITPLLAAMALGTFDVSMMVSREQQLQSAANEASEIILAASGGSGIIPARASTRYWNRPSTCEDKITMSPLFRCGTSTTTSSTAPTCPPKQMYSYVRSTLADSYTPLWTAFGVGHTVNFNITRTVQVG